MSKKVTEEMISAWMDGELSPVDRALVENAISTDESLRRVYEGYQEAGSAVKTCSEWTSSSVALPADFASRVMEQIQLSVDTEATESLSNELESEDLSTGHPLGVSREQQSNEVWSVRTLLEIVAAVAAMVVIAIVWQGRIEGNLTNGDSMAKADGGDGKEQVRPKSGVTAMGSKTGDFKKQPSNKGKKGDGNNTSPANAASRKFSVFVKADTRPSIDRFWILNNYEVTAPEGTEPNGNGHPVNVLLIDSKKTDAVKFFSQLQEWDPDFQVFQQAKAGNASWLAPFDVSRAAQAEGDVWTLQIVLINK